MWQNKEDMGFCDDCGMNAFPARPEFNTVLFVITAIISIIVMIIIIGILSVLFLDFSVLLLMFIILLNPYVIYYLLQPKKYCPRCRNELSEKNLAYEPFGNKTAEVYKKHSNTSISRRNSQSLNPSPNWHCPYCGKKIRRNANFCEFCGREFEIHQ